MKKELLSKTLVMGVVVLFIGVGVQSAFAINTGTSVNTVQLEEDCDCQAEGDVNLVKLKNDINRFKDYIRILSESSELNPLIQRKIDRLSDFLSKIENDITFGWPFPVICTLLFPIFIVAEILFMFSANPLFFLFYDQIKSWGRDFNCWWVPPWP